MTDTVTDTLEPVTQTVADTVQPVTDTVGQVVEPVTDTLEPVTQSLNDTLDPVTQTVTDTLDPVVQTVVDPPVVVPVDPPAVPQPPGSPSEPPTGHGAGHDATTTVGSTAGSARGEGPRRRDRDLPGSDVDVLDVTLASAVRADPEFGAAYSRAPAHRRRCRRAAGGRRVGRTQPRGGAGRRDRTRLRVEPLVPARQPSRVLAPFVSLAERPG